MFNVFVLFNVLLIWLFVIILRFYQSFNKNYSISWNIEIIVTIILHILKE